MPESVLLKRRALRAVAGTITIVLFGTIGYVVVADAPWLDALFMTVTTLTTVGYGEIVHPTQATRLFTIALIVFGVGTFGYLVSGLVAIAFDPRNALARARRAMQREIAQMREHVIVCGFGRFGRAVVDELRRGGKEVVIVEQEASVEALVARDGLPYVIGSGADESMLASAGIGQACAVVVATGSESENLFITLAARELRGDVRIHARAESEAAVRRLRRAGADQIVSPFHLGGVRTASAIVRPAVIEFLELSRPLQGEKVDLEEINVAVGSPLVGRAIGLVEQEARRMRIVARKAAGHAFELAPDPKDVLGPGDLLVVIGDREELASFARRAGAAE